MKLQFAPMDFDIKKMPDVAGVAVDSDDNIYYTTRIFGYSNTPVIVLNPEGKYLRSFGTGMIKNAHGIAIDRADNVYVVDGMRNCILKFDPDGRHIDTIGSPDSPIDTGCVNFDYCTIRNSTDSFNYPAKLSITDDGDLFIADGYGNARVHHYAKDGKHIKSWGEPGTAPGQFNLVHSVAVDEQNGDVYVCDRENERIQIFTYDGEFKSVWNDIWRPTDICIRGDNVFVAELGEILFIDNVLYEPGTRTHHSQLRVFDKKGAELAQAGTADGGAHGSFFAAHALTVNHAGEVLAGEVNFPREDVWIAYPEGRGMSHKFRPALQKFVQI
jgi:DNA-binding beta-propeller fold protein YncE